MHSLFWSGENDDEPDLTFLHNGDYSGDVHVVVPVSAIKDLPQGNMAVETKEVIIPFAALKYLVADYVRSRRISVLEDAQPDDILDSPDPYGSR